MSQCNKTYELRHDRDRERHLSSRGRIVERNKRINVSTKYYCSNKGHFQAPLEENEFFFETNLFCDIFYSDHMEVTNPCCKINKRKKTKAVDGRIQPSNTGFN